MVTFSVPCVIAPLQKRLVHLPCAAPGSLGHITHHAGTHDQAHSSRFGVLLHDHASGACPDHHPSQPGLDHPSFRWQLWHSGLPFKHMLLLGQPPLLCFPAVLRRGCDRFSSHSWRLFCRGSARQPETLAMTTLWPDYTPPRTPHPRRVAATLLFPLRRITVCIHGVPWAGSLRSGRSAAGVPRNEK
jgi:hypothetical protein